MRCVLLALVATIVMAADVVEVDKLWFLDEARGRNIGVKLYHPADGVGPWPIVMFSHGLGGSQWGYAYLGRHLAEHGIVSIHCSHPGSDWLLWDGKGMGAGIANLRTANADPVNWRERPRDITFLIDQLDAFESRVPALAGRLARDRIAAVGHSLGAYTVLALAGLRPTLPGEGDHVLADRRVRAVVAMSPQGSGGFLPPGCWAGVDRPVLLMTGTKDEEPFSGRDRGLAWRQEAWDGLPDGAKHLFILEGATHMTFSAGGMGEKASPVLLAAISTAVTAFLDAQLAAPPFAFTPPPVAGATWDQPVRVR
jgi:predicted dienelactone hydrolase